MLLVHVFPYYLLCLLVVIARAFCFFEVIQFQRTVTYRQHYMLLAFGE